MPPARPLFDEFKEAEHPRGQPGHPGQFASKPGAGGGKQPGGGKPTEKPTSKEQPDFRGSLAHETTQSTTQPVKSLEELYERAQQEHPAFKNTIESIASKYGSEAKVPGLKPRSSAERKLASELGNDPTKLRDVLRATVISHSVEDTRKAAADFIGEHGDMILRVKDRYIDVMKGGYRDILINYRTPGGLVAEIQFNSKNMLAAKSGGGHEIYEKIRVLKNPTREELEQLESYASALYEKAYEADGDGKGWQKQMKDSADQHDDGAWRRYKLSQPGGPEFEAAIVDRNGALAVVSNRDGEWKPDANLHIADLMMPEQALGDWEVTEVKGGTKDHKPLAFDVEDKIRRRAIDRDTRDIVYYTAQVLGPRRERTPEGFLICYDVPVARVGEMVYGPGEVPSELGVGRDGRIRVTRSEDEVFAPQSIASLNGKPVTDDHPPVDVEPGNWKFYTKGVVVNPRRGDGDETDFLIADLIIFDAETIGDIEAGKREVSCGYNPDYLSILDDNDEPIPGRGEQANIIYNHLALVQAGRCGPCCSIGDHKTVDTANQDFFTPVREARLRRVLRYL